MRALPLHVGRATGAFAQNGLTYAGAHRLAEIILSVWAAQGVRAVVEVEQCVLARGDSRKDEPRTIYCPRIRMPGARP
jgi:hypothetical protein